MATPSRSEVPDIVRALCDTHVTLVEEAAPGLLEGVHLHGSLGFDGEFHAGSDVDFVATVTRRPTDADVTALRRVHAEIGRRWDAPALDGCYLLAADLTGPPGDVPSVPGILGGWFDVGRHGDIVPITWRELRDHAVTMHGGPLHELGVWSDGAHLHEATRLNLDTYWRGQLEALEYHPREAALPQAAEWGALGAPRLHHLLVTGRPTSKSGGGRWALEAFPEHREVALEALRVRERPDAPSTYAADPARRARDLMALMGDVIADGVSRSGPPGPPSPTGAS